MIILNLKFRTYPGCIWDSYTVQIQLVTVQTTIAPEMTTGKWIHDGAMETVAHGMMLQAHVDQDNGQFMANRGSLHH